MRHADPLRSLAGSCSAAWAGAGGSVLLHQRATDRQRRPAHGSGCAARQPRSGHRCPVRRGHVRSPLPRLSSLAQGEPQHRARCHKHARLQVDGPFRPGPPAQAAQQQEPERARQRRARALPPLPGACGCSCPLPCCLSCAAQACARCRRRACWSPASTAGAATAAPNSLTTTASGSTTGTTTCCWLTRCT